MDAAYSKDEWRCAPTNIDFKVKVSVYALWGGLGKGVIASGRQLLGIGKQVNYFLVLPVS